MELAPEGAVGVVGGVLLDPGSVRVDRSGLSRCRGVPGGRFSARLLDVLLEDFQCMADLIFHRLHA
jgi:hypothetical protein